MSQKTFSSVFALDESTDVQRFQYYLKECCVNFNYEDCNIQCSLSQKIVSLFFRSLLYNTKVFFFVSHSEFEFANCNFLKVLHCLLNHLFSHVFGKETLRFCMSINSCTFSDLISFCSIMF